MNIHVDEKIRQQIKERRARLGYNQPDTPVVPLYRVRPAFQVPDYISEIDEPDFIDGMLEPKKELIFKPRLVKRKHPRVDDIVEAVAFDFKLTRNELLSRSRCREIIIPRHIVCYLARMMTPLSFPEIARKMDGRDHTTILHSWRKIRAEITEDEELRDRIADIMLMIRKGLGI